MTSDDESVTERRAIHRYQCPICERVVCVSKPQEAPYRPFCSERCKMTDLGRWFGEVYRTSEPASPDDFADAQLDDDSGNSADDSIR